MVVEEVKEMGGKREREGWRERGGTERVGGREREDPLVRVTGACDSRGRLG